MDLITMSKLMKGINGHGFYYGIMNPIANPLSRELPHRFIGGYQRGKPLFRKRKANIPVRLYVAEYKRRERCSLA